MSGQWCMWIASLRRERFTQFPEYISAASVDVRIQTGGQSVPFAAYEMEGH
jgi:hypothetical protein